MATALPIPEFAPVTSAFCPARGFVCPIRLLRIPVRQSCRPTPGRDVTPACGWNGWALPLTSPRRPTAVSRLLRDDGHLALGGEASVGDGDDRGPLLRLRVDEDLRALPVIDGRDLRIRRLR